MKEGDVLDAIAIGHRAIDLKGIMHDQGYAVPQTSAAKINTIPADVQAIIDAQKKSQERYSHTGESVTYHCSFCDTTCMSSWRKDEETGEEFLICPACNRVVKVR